ncbi:MAG: tetratricopeptide repeat protein, partial [Gammaproteobacteria bacterium]|nr:tetratricopeptide repeat protein [Gammaproteobacteria bacterium]
MRSNGAYLAAGVILGLGLLFGWNQYQRWELQRAELASDVYE